MDEQLWLWLGGQPGTLTGSERALPSTARPSPRKEPVSPLLFAYCRRKLPEGLGGTSRLASTDSAKKMLPDSHLWGVTLVHLRPHTLATKVPGCLLGSGKPLIHVLLSSAWVSSVPTHSSPRSAGASMSTPCPSALYEPLQTVLPALERGLPFIFSGRKCNA